jgi:hypothetical protein
VLDGNGVAVAYCYARDDPAEKTGGTWLTTDEARRIASGIAKLPELLAAEKTKAANEGK